MKLYVASSWRNQYQPEVVSELRNIGYDVYDFRNPEPGDCGFHLSEIDDQWITWTPDKFRISLDHSIAESGFGKDWKAMRESDACILVLPCGRSAHLEAGCFIGWGKPVIILIPEQCEPELMYKAANHICISISEVIDSLQHYNHEDQPDISTGAEEGRANFAGTVSVCRS